MYLRYVSPKRTRDTYKKYMSLEEKEGGPPLPGWGGPDGLRVVPLTQDLEG
jgi:hypothetical protein